MLTNNNTYSLDSLVSFNSKLEDYFTNTTTKAVNAVYENFLIKNINKLKNKDKSVLKEISKINVNYILIDNLNYLWNSGFNTNTNDFSSNVLTEFKLTDKEKITKNTKLTKTLNKEDIKIARDIRKTDIAEKRKTLKILKQDVITSDFGQTYLQERNKEIAKNFTNTYKEKIFSGINNYFDQKLSITREKNLINHLSFKRLSDLSKEEKAEYINEYDRLQEIYGLKTQSLATYDSLKFNPKERIRRIAKTELSAAYNLARYNELVNQGYIEFQVKNSGSPNCRLCDSKHNDIITINQITAINKGFTDFKGIDTRKDKNAYENRNLIFPPFHSSCRDYLIGVEKTKTTPEEAKTSLIEQLNNTKNLYKKVTAASSIVSLGSNLAGKFLALQQAKKDKEEENLLKMIIAGGSIMSMSMMYYFYTSTQLGNKVISDVGTKIATKASELVTETSKKVIDKTTDIVKDELREAVLNKDYIQTNLAETAFKPPTNETLSQYLTKRQREIINNQLSSDIQKYITKSDLEELLKKVIINAENITNLRDLGKGDLQQLKLSELEVLLNSLLINNKTNNKKKLIDIIYNKTDVKQVVAKIPLNIKEPDYVLIQNTETKLLTTSTKLERLGTNITKLNNEVKKNKSTYLKDIETLRELDSELTEQLVGIERINTEYTQLLETTTDKNLSRYLADKVTENNQKTSELRNKLNGISSDLYSTKLDKIDPNLKGQLITNIKDKGKQYLQFKNNRSNKVNSINATLNNYKKDISIDKLNIDYIDSKLAEVDKLDTSFKDLNKNSLVLDNMLSDYAILNKIDSNVNIDDLGYTFKSYLNTGKKRGIESLSVDDFRETSLNNTKVNLDNYKKKLIQAKYKLLNNETITEFKINVTNKFKKLCHIKLKNILERLRKV